MGAEKVIINTKTTGILILIVILEIGGYTVLQQVKAQESTVNWSPMFHHDLAHTGYSTSTGPLTNQTLWSYPTDNSLEYLSPAVVNGVVYVASYIDVYALNAETGNKIWSYGTSGPMYSSPAVLNGVVYVASGDNVYALNAKSGSKIWNYSTNGNVESSPAVANGIVYIGSDDSNVYALDATTGSKIWSYATGNEVECSPVVVNGVVYVGSDDNNVYAFGSIAVLQSSSPLSSPSPSPSPFASSTPSTSISNGSLLIIIGAIMIAVVIIGLTIGFSMKRSYIKNH